MSLNPDIKPAIAIDLRKYRIRIHKQTLHCLGSPEYILLLVNPKECTLAIIASNRYDPKAHRIVWDALINKKSYELYSRVLLENICGMCSLLKKNQSYRIYGEILPDEGMARFNMTEALPMDEVR